MILIVVSCHLYPYIRLQGRKHSRHLVNLKTIAGSEPHQWELTPAGRTSAVRRVLQPTQTANGGACMQLLFHATTVSARKRHNVHIAQWTASMDQLTALSLTHRFSGSIRPRPKMHAPQKWARRRHHD